MSILIIAEYVQQKISPSTLCAVQAAQKIGGEIDLAVLGSNCQEIAKLFAGIPGIRQVLVADHPYLGHPLADCYAKIIAPVGKGYSHLVMAATSFGKSLMPRVAALLDVAQISDVVAIVSPDIFVRHIYAGNATATIQSLDALKILTIRPSAFQPVASSGGQAAIKALPFTPLASQTKLIKQEISKSARPELNGAKIVVSGGRGLQNSSNFSLLEKLADKLGAALGASRAAVDAGFVPNDYQVGQTGKVVAPQLYIAVGISGAIQHLAGMKDSKVIVAINKDADAPIFQIADYGLVADLFEAVPAFINALDSK
ncbi:MAG: electron transfer flavoprotein subunit alpha/FixB family protein [Rhodospirillaceae bacterium]|nr:electron transfer flavoprotein subunit alpha/FixB family protein [Rhodospirillaceae bacterium]